MCKCNLRTSAAVLMITCVVWFAGRPYAPAQAQHTGHSHGGADASATKAAETTPRAPHGGQLAAAKRHRFEVVYQPKGVRLYVYGQTGQLVSPRGVNGQVTMQVRGQERVYRFPLKLTASAAGRGSQETLTAAVDLTRVRDGDMTVTFELANLPDPQEPRAKFTQTFALSKPSIVVTSSTAADQAAIRAQRKCAVANSALGSMGTPVKVTVGNQSLFLCCKGCVAKVKKNPDFYFAEAAKLRKKS